MVMQPLHKDMVRNVKGTDAKAIARIYNEYVINSVISFETTPVSVEDMRHRIRDISASYPYLVYETDGKIVGFCYVHQWKERAAYCHTVETTIYISSEYYRKGIGKRLMSALIKQCKEKGYKALIACITAGNHASESFHQSFGFKQVSYFESVGIKFGNWLNVSDYELLL